MVLEFASQGLKSWDVLSLEEEVVRPCHALVIQLYELAHYS